MTINHTEISNKWVAGSFYNRRYRGLPFDKEAFDSHIATLALKLDVYDEILSKQKYIAGDVCFVLVHN